MYLELLFEQTRYRNTTMLLIDTSMYKVKILLKETVTHNVNRYIVEKPKGYKFTPGQATDVAINRTGWKKQKHPFTFTCLNQDKVLEFTIKSYDPEEYKDHDGMTWHLKDLHPGDELILEEPFGTINYKGRGVFIAGGAGITPFIAIFKDLHKKGRLAGNTLIFSNKTTRDIILQKEFENMFEQDNLIFTLTQEENPSFEHGRIDSLFLKKHITDFTQNFYLCGPPPMVKGLRKILNSFGAKIDSVIFEE